MKNSTNRAFQLNPKSANLPFSFGFFIFLIPLILSVFTFLFLSDFLVSDSASATSSSSLNLGINEVLSLSIEAYDESTSSYINDPNLSMSIIPGTFKTASARITADTNAPYGYHLVLSNNDSNNALVEQNDDPTTPTSPVISSIATDTTISDTTDSTKLFPDNTWGYNLTLLSSNANNNNNTNVGDTPPTIPLTYSKIPTNTTSSTIANTTNLGSNTYTFTVGSRVDKVLPAGIYKDELVFSIIANAAPLAPSFYTTYYMQDFNQTTCNSVKTPTSDIKEVTDKYGSNYHDNGTNATIVPSTTLIDKRDNQEYTIRKLADGNCWMTENLRIGKESDVTLDGTNSNLVAGRTFDLPKAKTIEEYNTKVAQDGKGWSWDNQEKYPFTFYRNDNEKLDSSGTEGAPLNTVLYNWYTATAGARSSDNPAEAEGTLMTAESGQAKDSVCPKNWQLPINSNSMGDGVKSYGHLVGVYTGNSGNRNGNTAGQTPALVQADLAKLHAAPTSFVYSDRYYYGGTLLSRSIGLWWSSTVSSATNSYYLGLDNYSSLYYVYPQSSDLKGLAFVVRCVLAS